MIIINNKNNTEKMKKYYSEWWENPKDIRNTVFDRLNEYIRNRIPQGNGKKALDIGSGRGKIVSYLLEKGYDVTAVEINEEFAADLEINFPEVSVICDDVRNIDFDYKYDVVTCIELIQNLEKNDIKELLKKLSNLSNFLITNISNKNSFHSFYIDLRGWREDFVYLYEPQEFEDLLDEVNFKIVHERGIGLITPVSVFKNFKGKIIPIKLAEIINKYDYIAPRICHLYYVEADIV